MPQNIIGLLNKILNTGFFNQSQYFDKDILNLLNIMLLDQHHESKVGLAIFDEHEDV